MRTLTKALLLPLLVAPIRALEAQDSNRDKTLATETAPVSARWNRLIPVFMSQAAANRRAARAAAAGDSATLKRIAQTQLPMTFNLFTPTSMAQYAAASASRSNPRVSAEVAVAAASAAVLSALYTDTAVRSSIARELATDVARAGSPARAAAGKTLGEEIGRTVVARAPQLSMAAPWNGTIPKGPGMWYSAPGVPPIGMPLVTSRTWTLDSNSQFRPAPPPAFGSREWNAALEEVQRIARERTAEQTRIAQFWNSGDPWALWNETASKTLRKHRASEAHAARVLAVLNAAAFDAAIACFEAKYHFWTIRPNQADSTLKLADSVPLPNFPSFPSGHACSAGAFDAVLGHYFPQERAEFTKTAEEQAMSRLYGGVHYRFDNDIGLELGRKVGRHAIAREKKGALLTMATGRRK